MIFLIIWGLCTQSRVVRIHVIIMIPPFDRKSISFMVFVEKFFGSYLRNFLLNLLIISKR